MCSWVWTSQCIGPYQPQTPIQLTTPYETSLGLLLSSLTMVTLCNNNHKEAITCYNSSMCRQVQHGEVCTKPPHARKGITEHSSLRTVCQICHALLHKRTPDHAFQHEGTGIINSIFLPVIQSMQENRLQRQLLGLWSTWDQSAGAMCLTGWNSLTHYLCARYTGKVTLRAMKQTSQITCISD